MKHELEVTVTLWHGEPELQVGCAACNWDGDPDLTLTYSATLEQLTEAWSRHPDVDSAH
jgi:hypothetical protein